MKKIVFILLFFVPIVCGAQTLLEIKQDGEYRVKTDDTEKWEDSRIIVVEERAMEYADSFPKAIVNHGTPILVEKSEKALKLKLFFKKLVKVEKQEILYNDLKKAISLIESSEEKEEESYFILFGIISLFLMIISNIILFEKGCKTTFTAFTAAFVAVIFAFAAAVFAFAAAIAAFFIAFNFIAALASALAALVLIIVVVDNRDYKFFSVIYYILMTTYFVLLFL